MSNPYPYTIPAGSAFQSPFAGLAFTSEQLIVTFLTLSCGLYLVYPRFYTEAWERLDTMIWRATNAGSSGEVQEDSEVAMKVIPKIKRRSKTKVGGNAVHFPGMVNLSGTLCYMNSVLQAMSSLPGFLDYLDQITELAIKVDLPSPVTDGLLGVMQDLNTPHRSRPPALRPNALLQALMPLPPIQRLLATREHQDAHELFMVLLSAVSDEAVKIQAEARNYEDDGLASLPSASATRVAPTRKGKERVREPWEGLIARRRTCIKCGWSEGVRCEQLNGLEVTIPMSGETSLAACLRQFTAPEQLAETSCEMCSLRETIEWYKHEEARLNGLEPPSRSSSQTSFAALDGLSTTPTTTSKRRRAKDARRIHTRLQELLEAKDASYVGQEVPSLNAFVKWQTVRPGSTRQSMITRPPAILRCHLVRSEYTNWGTVVKKTARIDFPAVLEFTSHVAWNVWDEAEPCGYMLNPPELQEVIKNLGRRRKLMYRLESVICHYGYTHSFGHFVAYRRRPVLQGEAGARPQRGKKACPDGCICDQCIFNGQVRGDGDWLRISDADVEVVHEAEVLAERRNVFMLFYQRVDEAEEVEPSAVETESAKTEGTSGLATDQENLVVNALQSLSVSAEDAVVDT